MTKLMELLFSSSNPELQDKLTDAVVNYSEPTKVENIDIRKDNEGNIILEDKDNNEKTKAEVNLDTKDIKLSKVPYSVEDIKAKYNMTDEDYNALINYKSKELAKEFSFIQKDEMDNLEDDKEEITFDSLYFSEEELKDQDELDNNSEETFNSPNDKFSESKELTFDDIESEILINENEDGDSEKDEEVTHETPKDENPEEHKEVTFYANDRELTKAIHNVLAKYEKERKPYTPKDVAREVGCSVAEVKEAMRLFSKEVTHETPKGENPEEPKDIQTEVLNSDYESPVESILNSKDEPVNPVEMCRVTNRKFRKS